MLTGRVVVPSGESAAGVAVEVHWHGNRDSAFAIAHADGSFRIRVPGAPDAVLRAYRRGRLFGITPLDLPATTRADVRVHRVGRVRVVAPDGWAESGFDVRLAARDGSVAWDPESAWIEHGRVIVIEEAPAGTWMLRLVRKTTTVERTVVVVPGEETVVTFTE